MKIAIVHDWLVTYAGAERVLEQMLALYPDADLYSLIDFLPDTERQFLRGRPVRTSFLQQIPGARKHYRKYLLLMPLAIEQFDLANYDLVISSSYAVAKGVLTGPDQLHICMCYSPMRYAWDLQHQYLRETGLDRGLRSVFARAVLHYMRNWDVRTGHGVDEFIAISEFVARRIRKVYRREAAVIYPPVDVREFTPGQPKDAFYLTTSRLVPYKRIDLLVEAFSGMPDRRLVVVGDGPELRRIRSKAGSNVTLLGAQPLPVLRDHLQRARAFVFAAEEDFGIAPLEAQACGTPVIAFGKGGSLETIRGLEHPQPTGVFFNEQTVPAVQHAVQLFEREQHRISPAACRENALRFDSDRFRGEFGELVRTKYCSFRKAQGHA
ncbi:MAG TPA: glycosyltransferase family 4 protein [Gemmatimonadales bacterium]|nr:glycosyltransferase family 4 protein [Gemmatimonadales bacterium]